MPQASPDRPAVVRFGPFALDLQSGELSRDGARTRLQDQPLALLRCLIEHPGRLVTRDDLRRRLWPNGTIVDFEHGVNTALKRLRDALGDSADEPVYIETVPRRGYRFLAVVEVVAREGAPAGATPGGKGPRDSAPAPGASLRAPAAAGAYRVLEQLGAGGMGEVYRAEDLVLKRKVALKVLPAAFASDPDRLARFRREAEALASLNHPHICTLHAIGEAKPGELGLAAGDDGDGGPSLARPYLVMENIDGQTLAARLAKGPLPPVLVCDLGAQIADALAAAHERGVIHRDLKPANIMLTGTSSGRAGVPHVKLLDFGLAKLAGHGEQPALSFDSAAETRRATLTGPGTVLGTLPYMAPEQVEGRDADARTDIWALGTVLYEMAAGRQAFMADSSVSLASRILTADPAPPSSHQPLTPPALDHVVATCLAKDPELRWQAASDVARELRWVADEGRVGRTPGSGSTSDAATATALASARRARRWRVVTAAAGLVLLVAGALALVGVLQWQRPRVHDAAPSKVPEAYEYLRLAKLFSETQVDLPKAQQYLEKALALDPDFAQARAYYGETHMLLIDWGLANDTSMLYRAEAELSRALHDDPNSAKAYATLAAVYLYQGRKELVPQMARKAIELAADDKNGLLMLAIYHQWSGEYQQSQFLVKRIIESHPSYLAARVVSAENVRLMGDTEGSLREEGMVLEQDSRNVLSLLLVGLTHLTQGDTVKAREALARARGLEPQNYQVRVLWAVLLAVEGRRGEALREMDAEVLKYGKLIPVATNVAEFYAVLGDRAKALEWLDHAVRVGDERTDWFERDPLLANIRTDPGFRQIVEGIHIRRKQLDQPAR